MSVVRWITLAGMLLGAACAPPPEPPDLVGVWRTQAASHRDRKLEIQPGWIVFGTGGESTESFQRDGLEVEAREDGKLVCTLFYRDPYGDRGQIRLVADPKSPDALRFENRDEIWRRTSAPLRTSDRG